MKTNYQVDPAHSSIQFSIRHMMISNVRGSFSGVSGTVAYDRDAPETATVNAEVAISTLSTGDAQRDAHVKSPDFFDADKYPKMTFTSRSVEKSGDDEYKVTGDLTLRGVTKELVLTASDVTSEGKDPWGNWRFGAVVKGKLSRKDFGLTWSAPLETGGVVLGDDVKIEMEVQLVKQQAAV